MGEKKFKFDVVIGNPPYQEDGKGDNARAEPIYHHFISQAYKVSSIAEFITPGRFLFNAGQTPKKWNKQMLNDEHITVTFYEQKSSKVFANTDIKGGVVVTLRDDKRKKGPIGVFTPFEELNSIVKKVWNDGEQESLMTVISSRGTYRFTEKMFQDFPNAKNVMGKGSGNMIVSNSFDRLPDVLHKNRKENTNYKILGRYNGKREYRFISKDYVLSNEYINKYNVFVPEANGTGAIGEVLSTPLIGEPLIGHTDTFISIGMFDNSYEAENCLKYVKSNFARTMLGVLKVTQHNPRSTWKYVPLQDFTANSDIDWTKSIPEIDCQLYKKYNLSSEEINFIETHVKEMD
ncbi:Eco57I restriction-modification methylase domain-containing protein [Ligilactobacillus ruminis]|uniref:Eco57I restriction-modification methylase domain-containing protein n=1 Tax=Ligilactobacillus ruminis TaxID=1623 RepID=UPI00265AAB56|nr:Eco57I restriction-modification methylase domain-containing protein [Ligilactobacillus ruminis]WKB70245.1 Eco57I restriction-modification methylase domain-containing protein [Ligilactobacillus ruminis]